MKRIEETEEQKKARAARSEILDAVFGGYNDKCILDEFMKHKNDLSKDDFFGLIYQWREYINYRGGI